MPTNTRDEKSRSVNRRNPVNNNTRSGQRPVNHTGSGQRPPGRRLTREEKLRRRRKRIIQVWIRRLLALLVLVLLIVGVVFGIRRLFGGGEASSVYGLPDYVTEDYLQINTYSRPKVPLQTVNSIVIHYTANPGTTAEQNRDYFNNLADQSGTENATYASSNFIVGLEGEVIACVPIDEVAYASNNRNEDSLSIETCHPDETGQFNEATYQSLVRLTAYLCNRFGLTSEDVIRHYDVSGKLCPLYFVENEDAWTAFKADVQSAIDALAAENGSSAADGGESAGAGAADTTAAADFSSAADAASSSDSAAETGADSETASAAESASDAQTEGASDAGGADTESGGAESEAAAN